MQHSTENSKLIKSSPERLYEAFADPKALEIWQGPGEMMGKVHQFNLKGGRVYYVFVLSDCGNTGKDG